MAGARVGVRTDRHSGMLGSHDPPPAQAVGRGRVGRKDPRGGAGRLRPDHRPGAGGGVGGRAHHQGVLWWGQGRPVPGGPAQTGTEALHGHRGRRRAPGLGLRRTTRELLRPTLAAATAQVGPMPEQAKAHLDAAYYDSPTRELLEEFGFDGEISRKGVPAPIQVGQRQGGRAHQLVGERVRQAVPLHRTRRHDRGLLPLPGRCVAHCASPHPASPHALPLGHPTHRPMAEVIPIAERSKPCRHWERGRVSPRRQRVRRWSVA